MADIRVFVQLHNPHVGTANATYKGVAFLKPPLEWNAVMAEMLRAASNAPIGSVYPPAVLSSCRIFLLPSVPNGKSVEIKARALRGIRNNDQFVICQNGEYYAPTSSLNSSIKSSSSVYSISSNASTVSSSSSNASISSAKKRYRSISGKLAIMKSLGEKGLITPAHKAVLRDLLIQGDSSSIEEALDRYTATGDSEPLKMLLESATRKKTDQDIQFDQPYLDDLGLDDAVDLGFDMTPLSQEPSYPTPHPQQQVGMQQPFQTQNFSGHQPMNVHSHHQPSGQYESIPQTHNGFQVSPHHHSQFQAQQHNRFNSQQQDQFNNHQRTQYNNHQQRQFNNQQPNQYNTQQQNQLNNQQQTQFTNQQQRVLEQQQEMQQHLQRLQEQQQQQQRQQQQQMYELRTQDNGFLVDHNPMDNPMVSAQSQLNPMTMSSGFTGTPGAMYNSNVRMSNTIPGQPNSDPRFGQATNSLSADAISYLAYGGTHAMANMDPSFLPDSNIPPAPGGFGYPSTYSHLYVSQMKPDRSGWVPKTPLPSYPPPCSPEEKRKKIERWLIKRKNKNWSSKPSYPIRHNIASSRPRGANGRFIPKAQLQKMKEEAEAAKKAAGENESVTQ